MATKNRSLPSQELSWKQFNSSYYEIKLLYGTTDLNKIGLMENNYNGRSHLLDVEDDGEFFGTTNTSSYRLLLCRILSVIS